MRINYTGKNIIVTDAMKATIEQKLGRISKLFPDDIDAFVLVSVVKNDHTIEVTIPIRKRILRAEVTKSDTYVALDEVVDILERQMVKYKGRLHNRSMRDNKFKEEFNYFFKEETVEDTQNGIVIEKSKKFALKPMDAEEAVIEMEMLGHNFYVFRNGETDEVNVIYKRKTGTYGLIEPEY